MRPLAYALTSALFAAALGTPAQAQVAVDEIRAQLFLERSGKLSENLVGGKKALFNTVTGGGDAGEPADAILVTLVFSGAKNTKSSDKIARDLASITVKQQAKTGERILLRRVYGGFLFGESGRIHKAFLLDSATCAPLEIEVKVGRSRKEAKLDFSCAE
ncbi:hypothetical protein DWF00_00600 [Bosea caraganae]|uniref:Uncharacterized protein n=1 Tax=Bosea caraganae TaxID=2763117 RepID=A0A370L9R3_9HYPH|nr:hypothetical protein [Bosea caraganae]RDJ26712.1 hypothetical protein DWE98_07615 [Bosea caraganae]RDJ30599.1 hypothetical protein DWF00_00600 [Bosea caraganae]